MGNSESTQVEGQQQVRTAAVKLVDDDFEDDLDENVTSKPITSTQFTCFGRPNLPKTDLAQFGTHRGQTIHHPLQIYEMQK